MNSPMTGPTSAEHGLLQMAARCEQAEASRDRLAALVEKLRPYLAHQGDCDTGACESNARRHGGTCPNHPNGTDPCICGLADLLTEMEKK